MLHGTARPAARGSLGLAACSHQAYDSIARLFYVRSHDATCHACSQYCTGCNSRVPSVTRRLQLMQMPDRLHCTCYCVLATDLSWMSPCICLAWCCCYACCCAAAATSVHKSGTTGKVEVTSQVYEVKTCSDEAGERATGMVICQMQFDTDPRRPMLKLSASTWYAGPLQCEHRNLYIGQSLVMTKPLLLTAYGQNRFDS